MSATPSKELTNKNVRSVRFGFYSPDEVRRMSVKRIVQPVIFDNLKNAVPGGLYDSAMGPVDPRGRCGTCSLPYSMCPGHFGHIELPVPVYNPIIFNNMYKILRQQCHFCFKFRMDREEVARFERKLSLLVSGRLTDAAALQVARGAVPKELEGVLEGSEKMPDASGLFTNDTNYSGGPQRLAPTLTSHTLEAIQDTISDFFARVPKGRCRNCEAHSPNVKRHGHMRLFKQWGSAKAVMHNLKTGKFTRSVLSQMHQQQQDGFGVRELEEEMAASMQEQQVKRRAAANKRTSSSKRQKQDSGATVTQGKEEEKEEEEEGWGTEDEEEEKAGLEALVEEGAQGFQSAEQKKEEKVAQRGQTDELEYGMIREHTMRDGAAALEDIDLGPKYITPTEVEEMLRRLWASEWRLLALIFGPGNDLTKLVPGSKQPGRSNIPPSSASAPAPFTSLHWSKEAQQRIQAGYQMFFVHTLPVVPNKFRPPSRVGEDMFEHPQNVALQRILTACLELSSEQETAATPEQLQNVVQPEKVKALEMGRKINIWLQLQDAVAGLMDSTQSERASAEKQQGIRQVLEKKEGLFRKNMMGKRVNYAARSVISPDPYIGAGEIGVPPYFAKRLCFPEKVTPWNVERLRQAVLRGANELNGAVAVEDERGRVVQLERMDRQKREGIAKALLSSTASGGKQMFRGGAAGAAATPASKASTFQAPNKTVFRHLQDGDIMLTNRQPTLHKPGLMAHRARVLKGEKTIRMHYANCSTFNADFDGDEINLHMPQDHYGRAEGALIVHADQQYIVPTDGKPLRGLIQDHVVSGVLLTKRDTWLTKAEYTQLVYIACNAWQSGRLKEGPEEMELEQPAILKPRMLWSGKQVMSTAVSYYTRGLPPLTFSGGSKVPADYWGGKKSGESELIIYKGYLVSGCLDKAAFGKFGLVHAVQELYGATTAGRLLNSFSRVFTAYMQWHGFTCGFDDLLLKPQAEAQRAAILSRAEAIAIRTSAEFVGLSLPEHWVEDPEKYVRELKAAEKKVSGELATRYRANRDTGKAHDMKGSGCMHPISSEVVKVCLPGGQVKAFPRNCLSLMTVSGAKGSLVNFSQISCLLGQQELEGRRVPRMSSGKTLPCFGEYDAGARSCGFVGDRFLTGLRPQEYYFHCMAGREGLVDTTVKTSRSGYLQRCLVKNLEALRVHYDSTVRDDGDGSIVQFLYGEDGLDATQVSYMTQQLGFLAVNAQRFAQSLDLAAAAEASKVAHLEQSEVAVEKALCARAARAARIQRAAKKGDVDKQRKLLAEMAQQLPIMAQYPPSVRGSVSEFFADKLMRYLQDNPDGLLLNTEGSLVPAGAAIDSEAATALLGQSSKDPADSKQKKKELKLLQRQLAAGAVDARKFCSLMQLKYMKALAAPGEAVGVLCAQSLGEPSTQMTLNTFHSAGQGGAANVTLGIPRLREILMTAAAKIKTPVMTLPLRPGLPFTDAQVLGGRLRRLRLAECLAGISLEETPVKRDLSKGYVRQYIATLKFFGPSQYPPEYKLSFKELSETFAGPFCAQLKLAVEREVRKKGGSSGSSASLRIGKLDVAAVGGEEAAAARAGDGAGADEDAETRGSNRASAKRARDDMEEGDEEEEPREDEEEDEAMAEGKQRFRGANDETTYDAPDEEDQEVAAAAARASRGRGLGAQGEAESSDSSDGEDEEDIRKEGGSGRRAGGLAGASGRAGEEEGEPEDGVRADDGKGGSARGRKLAKGEDGKGVAKAGTAEKKGGAGGMCGLSDPSSGVDYATHTCSVTISLPLKAPKLLLLEVVEKVAANVMVRATPNIEKVYVLQGERGEGPRVQTDGINLEGVWQHADLIDVNSIQTNDIAAMLRTYGVEAARATILNEVKAVFGAYGIAVDPRHLCLLADFMTQQGSYRACNRIGIESSVSPFLKMSFETAAHFLTEATLKESVDDMRTPSARLCMGQVVELGTGVMGIMQHLK